MKTILSLPVGLQCASYIPNEQSIIRPIRLRLWLTVVATVFVTMTLRAGGPTPALVPTPTNGVFGFQWQGDSNAIYTVQSSTNPRNPGSWVVEEPVKTNNAGPIRWMAPEAIQGSKFYRLLLAQPGVFSVEPAVVVTDGLVTLYLNGQDFTSKDVISSGGVVQTNVQFISSSLVSVVVDTSAFTPDVPGSYQLQLTSGSTGQTTSYTYAWSLVSSPASSTLLLEPPQEPPASPVVGNAKERIILRMERHGDASVSGGTGGRITGETARGL